MLGLVVLYVGSWFGLFDFKWFFKVCGWWWVGIVVVCWLLFVFVVICVIVLVGLFVLFGYKISYNDCDYLLDFIFVN